MGLLNNRRVLIIGGSGFIGKYTSSIFHSNGWNVIVANRNHIGLGHNYTFFSLDLSNPLSVLDLIKIPKCDAIVHLGATVNFISDNAREMYVNNSLATACVAKIAKEWGAYLLYASTVAVYGRSATFVDINSPLYPDTNYAKSKFVAEELIKGFGIDCGVLRIAGVFGCNGPKHLSINQAIANASQGVPPILSCQKEAMRNYIYVKDVAKAILETTCKRVAGVMLLSGREVLSTMQMLNMIVDVFIPSKSVQIDFKAASNDFVVKSTVNITNDHSFKNALNDIKKELFK